MTEFYHDIPYLKLVEDILENGVLKPNRTGVDTLSVFSRQLRFNLEGGSIPLLTTKRMHTRSIIYEILWYLKGTGSGKYLKEHNVNIWNEWMDEDDHLNRVYGYQWRRWPVPENNQPVVIPQKPYHGINAPFVHEQVKNLEPSFTGNPRYDDIIGKTFISPKYGEYVVISKETSNGDRNSFYKIQFKETTSVINVSRPQIKANQVRDPWKKTVANEGCLGKVQNRRRLPYQIKAYNLWYNMMRRCHDPALLPEYLLYGENGIFVDQSWRCFSNFLHDIRYLPGFDSWIKSPNKYSLDKDYYGSSCYSKDTCVFVSNKYSKQLCNHDGSKIVATKNKQTLESTSAKELATQIGCYGQQIIDCLNHPVTNKSVHGYKVSKIHPPNGTKFRKQIFVDQIASLIDTLKKNPNDRRLIVSAWNVSQISAMALPPCHYAFQFYVANNKLSCMLNQRSADTFLGVPFNIVQYSILTHMIAQVTNLEPGEFIWNGGDVHLYVNHLEQCNLQLSRKPYPAPTLSLNTNITNIDDFTYDDFEIVGYQHHQTIKAPVAV